MLREQKDARLAFDDGFLRKGMVFKRKMVFNGNGV